MIEDQGSWNDPEVVPEKVQGTGHVGRGSSDGPGDGQEVPLEVP